MKISNFHLAIMIPLSFPMVPASFFHSFVQMERPDYTYIHADNGAIPDLRNNLIETALAQGCTHGIQLDVDQVYHPLTIPKLLSHNLPIVGALVHRRYPPFDSLVLRKISIDENTDGYESVDDWEDGELLECDATGGGCLMFNMEIFRKIPYPWFEAIKEPSGQVIGEDINFCQKLKAAGYRIFVDTSVPAGHLSTMVINTATNRLYRSVKNKQAMNQALKVDKPL
jgi:hypothetical protein